LQRRRLESEIPTAVLKLAEFPETLFVAEGGYIGLELGTGGYVASEKEIK
jgi:pyruvate/2-oxoglutarate dehydrogenase complex dihydrolipoamide dehydrogenase (E3) component